MMLPVSESTTENVSASLVISCWTYRLSSGFNPDKSMLSKTFCWCSLISSAVMSLFPCSTSFSISSLFKLDWIIKISAFLLTCKGEIYKICWRLPTIVFFGINISCFELLMTRILRRWFISDLTETIVSAVSNPPVVQFPLFQKAMVFCCWLP